MIITIGIDPGKTGAVAVVGNGRELLSLEKTPMIGSNYNVNLMSNLVGPWGAPPSGDWSDALCDALLAADVADEVAEHDRYVEAVYTLVARRAAETKRCCQLAIIERQAAFKVEGPTAILTTGRGWGIWLGLLTANRVPYEEVSSAAWQRSMGVYGVGKGKDGKKDDKKKKAAHVAAASRLFPGLNLLASQHGKADALLMAVYAYRRIKAGA